MGSSSAPIQKRLINGTSETNFSRFHTVNIVHLNFRRKILGLRFAIDWKAYSTRFNYELNPTSQNNTLDFTWISKLIWYNYCECMAPFDFTGVSPVCIYACQIYLAKSTFCHVGRNKLLIGLQRWHKTVLCKIITLSNNYTRWWDVMIEMVVVTLWGRT